jgi:hypothetical protein
MTTDVIPAQTPTERTLAENEAIIAAGIDGFIETGLALADVRDREQYRDAGYTTFGAYLADRWPELSRAQAYRAIDTARFAGILSPMGDSPPNERQARELAPLRDDPEAMREVWQQARAEHGEALTAADVRDAVQEFLRPDEDAAGETEPRLWPAASMAEADAALERRQPLHDFLAALTDAPRFGLLSYKSKRILPLTEDVIDRGDIRRGLTAVRAWLDVWEHELGIAPATPEPKRSKVQWAAQAVAAGVGAQTFEALQRLQHQSPEQFQRVLRGEASLQEARFAAKYPDPEEREGERRIREGMRAMKTRDSATSGG